MITIEEKDSYVAGGCVSCPNGNGTDPGCIHNMPVWQVTVTSQQSGSGIMFRLCRGCLRLLASMASDALYNR